MEKPSNEIVSVVVVTCGGHEYIKPCLDSVHAQTYPHLQTVIIDNSLKKDFALRMAEQYPGATIYSASSNLFYCGGLNKGISLSCGDFILCLNDDVILDAHFIEYGLRGFRIDPAVGMVSGKIVRMDGITLDSTGLYVSLWGTARERGYGRKDGGQFQRPGFVFGVTGAAAFYRRHTLLSIREAEDAYCDPVFRFFYEDLDMSWRAQRKGWKAYYVPQATAMHARGATVRAGCGVGQPYARLYLSDGLQADLIKNRYLTIIKNASFWDVCLRLPFLVWYELLVWGYAICFRPRLIRSIIPLCAYAKAALHKRRSLTKRLYRDR
ncbi:MAG TPA: glycosyltransferase [Patescibacteria group bacterium]|nr:glycosyltransferase [Patescibacteria group bacterium]